MPTERLDGFWMLMGSTRTTRDVKNLIKVKSADNWLLIIDNANNAVNEDFNYLPSSQKRLQSAHDHEIGKSYKHARHSKSQRPPR